MTGDAESSDPSLGDRRPSPGRGPADLAQTTARLLHLAGALLYALFPLALGPGHGLFGTEHDAATVGMAVLFLALALGGHRVPFLAARPHAASDPMGFAVSVHMLWLVWTRGPDVAGIAAVLVVMAAMTASMPFTLPTRSTVAAYVTLMVAGSALVERRHADDAPIGAILVVSCASLGLVIFVAHMAWQGVVGKLRAAERDRARVLRAAPIALVALDRDRRVTFAEGKGLAALGLGSDIVGRVLDPLDPTVPAMLLPALVDPATARLDAVVRQGERSFEVAFESDRGGGVVAVVTDVTARADAERALLLREQKATHDALHDALTGLPNRTLLHDRLERVIARQARRPEPFAVLFLDLDRFKTVNDGLGHLAGDALLRQFAARLRACTRPTDTLARLGGDEFALLMEGVHEASEVHRVATRIQTTLRAPFDLMGHEVVVTASIGIAMAGAGYDSPDALLRDADIAMYRAKSGGRDQFVLFDEGMHAEAMELLRVETELRRAVQRGEIDVHLQPIVSFAYHRTCGFEALVRWHHPVRGLLHPAAFVGVAEDTGLIVPLGFLVIRKACEVLRALRLEFPQRSWLQISVNLSAKQFAAPDLVAQVRAIVEETGVDPRGLVFEITESALMEDLDEVLPVLEGLRGLGAHIEIDDFGTGYSSLAYLHRIPFDRLKVDRSFVGELSGGGEQLALVTTIVALARNLGVGVVAEGVETAEQCAAVARLCVDAAQGYYFALPMRVEEAIGWLVEDREWQEARSGGYPAIHD